MITPRSQGELLECAPETVGRPTFQATDLASLTARRAELCRSAIEAAGLLFIVDCDRLPEPLFVIRGMWERIVRNLLLTALKHTFDGEIALELGWRTDHAELVVCDTGVGIPKGELARLLGRLHTADGRQSPTLPGSGGLGLVAELARHHGGEVNVESREGRGSRLAVRVPAGAGHLPGELLAQAAVPSFEPS